MTNYGAMFHHTVEPELAALGVSVVAARHEAQDVLSVVMRLPEFVDRETRRGALSLLSDFEDRCGLGVDPTFVWDAEAER